MPKLNWREVQNLPGIVSIGALYKNRSYIITNENNKVIVSVKRFGDKSATFLNDTLDHPLSTMEDAKHLVLRHIAGKLLH